MCLYRYTSTIAMHASFKPLNKRESYTHGSVAAQPQTRIHAQQNERIGVAPSHVLNAIGRAHQSKMLDAYCGTIGRASRRKTRVMWCRMFEHTNDRTMRYPHDNTRANQRDT